jgi:hypothetical protein
MGRPCNVSRDAHRLAGSSYVGQDAGQQDHASDDRRVEATEAGEQPRFESNLRSPRPRPRRSRLMVKDVSHSWSPVTLPDYFSDPDFAGHFKVLEVLRRWDPIGVICDDNQDEYDGYSVGFMRLLDAGASVDDLVREMRGIVLEHMGMPSLDEAHARACATELAEFWRSWKDG